MKTYDSINKKAHIYIQLEPYGFKRQLELATFAADRIMADKFPGVTDCSFREFNHEDDKVFESYCNETFTIKSQNQHFLSKVTMRLSLVRLGANFPDIVDVPYSNLVDQMKEFLNQFLGVINQNILDIYGMEFRIGIPSHVQLINPKGENIEIPGVRLIDTTGTFDINIGYVRISGREEIDLKNTEFKVKSEEEDIEFF